MIIACINSDPPKLRMTVAGSRDRLDWKDRSTDDCDSVPGTNRKWEVGQSQFQDLICITSISFRKWGVEDSCLIVFIRFAHFPVLGGLSPCSFTQKRNRANSLHVLWIQCFAFHTHALMRMVCLWMAAIDHSIVSRTRTFGFCWCKRRRLGSHITRAHCIVCNIRMFRPGWYHCGAMFVHFSRARDSLTTIIQPHGAFRRTAVCRGAKWRDQSAIT